MTRRSGSPRPFPRTARVNQLVQEIVADRLERLDDDRLQLVTVTGVKVDPDLRHGTVFVDTPEGERRDVEVLEVLERLRPRLQAAVGQEARLKRTPELAFRPDPATREGARIEAVIRELHRGDVRGRR